MRNQTQAPENTSQFTASNARRFGEVSQISFLRVGALGDLLVSLAALEEALLLFPKAKAWIIGPKLWLEIIDPRLWNRVNGIIVLDSKISGQLYLHEEGHTPGGVLVHKGWSPSGVSTRLSEFYEKCQASINLRVESYRYGWGPYLALVRYRFGTCPWPLRFLYTNWSPWLGKDPIIHERDRMLHILEAGTSKSLKLISTRYNRDHLKADQTGEFGKSVDKLKVHQPNQQKGTLAFKWRDRALPQISMADPTKVTLKGFAPGKYWLINPTASRWEKAWPKLKFKEFVSRLAPMAKAGGRELLVIGSPQESDWLNEVAGRFAQVVQPENVGELSNWVHLAELVVTNTSAVQFIAACTKTPTLTLMGRTFPARWGPLGTQDAFVVGTVPSDFKGGIFEEDYAGYDSLSVDQVFEAFQNFRANLPK